MDNNTIYTSTVRRQVPALFMGMCALLVFCNFTTESRLKKGNALLESGDFLGARRVYEHIIEHEPESFAAHYGLGMSWCAETIYKTELGLAKPDDWFAAIYHMTIAMNIREDERVLKTLGILYFNLGTCFKKQNDIENAIKLMEQSLVYDPALLKALNLLGAMYHERNNFKIAEQYYLKAVAVQPQYALAYYNLGALAWVQKEYTRAASYFQQAVSLEPENGYFREWLTKATQHTDQK